MSTTDLTERLADLDRRMEVARRAANRALMAGYLELQAAWMRRLAELEAEQQILLGVPAAEARVRLLRGGREEA